MKTNKRQQEKVIVKTKTKPPHSIGSVSAKMLPISKKSQVIQKQPAKSATIQSKLVPVRNENGAKTLIVTKVEAPASVSRSHATRQAKNSSVVLKPAAQVELKTTDVRVKVERKDRKSNAQTEPESKATINQSIICEHCNLHCSTPAWLKKHISRCHSKALSEEPKSNYDQSVKFLKYQKQLEDIQQTLDKKVSRSKKKSKMSPTKQKLREQLKTQLAAQQQLLQVQQEIFEKTSKAQQDIFQLIAKLEDDSDGVGTDDESEVDEEEDELIQGNLKQDDSEHVELCFEDQEDGELIVPENSGECIYLNQNDGYVVEEQLITDESNMVVLNENIGSADADHGERPFMVVLNTEDGEEKYQLVDIIDPMYEENQLDEIENNINIEVVDKDNKHYRIVANEDPLSSSLMPEDVEYVDVQVDQKVPIKLDVGNIQQIAQKHFNKQLEGDKNDDGKDNKLLNSTINKSEKQTNEYIQKVVQNAVATDDNKFECPICHEMVSNRYSLGPHILRLHSKQKSKICQFCDRSFTCTGDLTRHVRIHTGEKPFKCTYPNCTYAFRASGDLHKHMRRHNSATVNIRQHVCTQCDRAFERNYDLKRHELTHKKNQEGVGYHCEFCSKRFVRKDQHKAHVYRHLGIKQYKCPDCDRRFSDFSNCSKHIRLCVAGDVKPFGSDDNDPQYICEICNKRFKSKIGMKQHVLKCAKITELQKKLQESFKQMEDD